MCTYLPFDLCAEAGTRDLSLGPLIAACFRWSGNVIDVSLSQNAAFTVFLTDIGELFREGKTHGRGYLGLHSTTPGLDWREKSPDIIMIITIFIITGIMLMNFIRAGLICVIKFCSSPAHHWLSIDFYRSNPDKMAVQTLLWYSVHHRIVEMHFISLSLFLSLSFIPPQVR